MKTQNKTIEIIYPLSPMQRGMLFHTLLAPEEMAYFQQIHWSYEGPLDAAALRQAWDLVVERHAILRTGFVWDKHTEPLQVVRHEVSLPWQELDFTDLAVDERKTRFHIFLQEDKQRHFSLEQAPLMRCTLIRTAVTEHYFVWTHHHLLLDGWSYSNMFGEIFSAYAAFSTGEQPQLRAPVPFRNYILWLKKQDNAAAAQFWRRTLKGFYAPNPLGVTRSIEAPEEKNGLHLLVFSESDTSRMREAAKEQHLTLTTLVHAAWGLMLRVYSGEWDVTYGSLVSGRSTSIPGVEAIVGMLINTLPLRMNMTPDMSLKSCLQQLQDQMAERDAYSFSGLVDIQASSDVPSGTPLFETVLVFENYPFGESLGKDDGAQSLKIRDVHMFGPTNYPLTSEVNPGQELTFAIKYDGALFDLPTIQRLAGHLNALLLGMTKDFSVALQRISPLSDQERVTLLEVFNQTESPFPDQSCFADLFAHQAQSTPDAIAVSDGTQQLTYHQLQQQAQCLGAHLQVHGIGPETVTAIYAERSIAFLSAILGTFSVGGAYLPLDIQHPQGRTVQVLQLARPDLVLTSRALSEALVEAVDLIDMEARPTVRVLEELLEQSMPRFVQRPSTSSNLAYIIYTSGSTGVPKGAMVHQRGMVNHLYAKVNDLDLVAADRVAQNAPQSFDISVWQFLCALLVGGETRVISDELSREPIRLMEAAEELTILEVVPSMLRAMIDEIDGNPERFPFACLRWLLLTGEALPPALSRDWLVRYPHIPIVNAYGPTECSDDVTHYRIEWAPAPDLLITPIGTTIANTKLYVVDKLGAPVPLGVSGELLVGGVGVGRGYLGDAARTAAVFIPDSFDAKPGERLYRTGDLVRHRIPSPAWETEMPPLEFLGRIDFQVKIRGFRIEIGEIEAVLQEHEHIGLAVVTQWQDEFGKKLVAYMETGERYLEEIRGHLKSRLPDYMVPSLLIPMDQLPINPNGKVDRKALPNPDLGSSVRVFAAPRNPIEQTVADIWMETLGVSRVGIGDTFFELGGHSLLATRVIVRIRALLGVELPLRDIFEVPVFEDLASRLATLRRGGTVVVPPIPRAIRTSVMPLSFAQQRIWFLDQLEGPSAIYNMPSVLNLKGHLDMIVLERTLTVIFERHENLRTTFQSDEGNDYQVVSPAQPISPNVIDLRSLPYILRDKTVRSLSNQDARTPFYLDRGPLLRVTLLILSEDTYVLLATMHHIISDDWSIGLFVKELGAHYGHYTEQVARATSMANSSREALDAMPSPLPELPIQYPDFAVWQKDWLKGEALDDQLSYWKDQLKGIPELLTLPTDFPRPANQSYRGGNYKFQIPASLFGEVLKLNRKTGSTPFMVLVSLYALLLARYSGQDDICIGTPVANRGKAELESLIGFFINTLVIRAKLAENPSFSELLAAVREACLDAYTHQDIPFEKLVDELRPERHLSHAPVFQAMFVLQNAPMDTLTLPGLSISGTEVESGTAKFDINLLMVEKKGPDGPSLQGHFEYATDLFEPATIVRMKDHFIHLLTTALDQPQTPCWDLAILGESERSQILLGLNDTACSRPEALPHQLFEAFAARTPQALAVVLINDDIDAAIDHDRDGLTYAQLNARANRLAHFLVYRGVTPGVRVALSLERSLDLVVSVLAILKAGAVVVPLDPAYPAARLTYMVHNTACKLVITQDQQQTNLPAGLLDAIDIYHDGAEIATLPEYTPAIIPHPQELFFIIHTSGSTGMPKSVALSQGAMANLIHWRHETVMPGFGTLQFASLSFDASFHEMFGAWSKGDTLFMILEHLRFDAAGLLIHLARHGVSKVILPVVLLQLWAEVFAEQPELFAHFREIITTGEQLQVTAPVRAMFQALPECTLHNHYGPSETHVVTSYSFDRDPKSWRFHAPIGKPVSNSACYILDERLQPQPIGVVGSLYLGGFNLARGYLGQPGLTAEKFMPDLFSAAGGRLYNTGDLARYLADGNIEFLGRKDHQVKLRGFRIELGEIEAALGEHEHVNECVVICRESQGEKMLVAYAVPVAGEHLDKNRLREHLKAQLPDYMVPAHFVILHALPLNPNGKIDRNALPEHDRSGNADTFVAPRSELEKTLAHIWENILDFKGVGVYDNFFEIGGHSLTATRVTARVRTMLQVELQLRDIFSNPRLVDLAKRIVTLRGSKVKPPAPMKPVPRDKPLPLAFSQKRLWFLDRLEPENPSFNITRPLLLKGHLDLIALELTMRREMQRHEILRTIYLVNEDGPYQQVLPDIPYDLWVVDISDTCDDPWEKGMELSFHHGRVAFNLEKAPLFCLTVLRLSPLRHIVLIKLHHILSDGWSRGVLVRDFREFYSAAVEEREPNLEPLPIQFGDYAVWQHNRNEVLEAQLDHWVELMQNAPTLNIPTDKPRPPVFRSEGHTYHFDWAPEFTAQVHAFALKHAVTPYMVLLAAFKILLARYSGQRDIVVGTPIANRTYEEVKDLIGFFLNVQGIRTNQAGNPTFLEFLAQVREVALDAYDHQETPFNNMVEKLNPKRDLSRHPIFQTFFHYDHGYPDVLTLPLIDFVSPPLDNDTAKFDIMLALAEDGGYLRGFLEYSTNLYLQKTIEDFVDAYRLLVSDLIAHPDKSVEDLSILSEEHRNLVLGKLNHGKPIIEGHLIQPWFAAAVAMHSQATALVVQDNSTGEEPSFGAQVSSLTFTELDVAANRLAFYLRDQGIGPGQIVGLCMRRTPAMIVAIMGILKSGAAYLPIDPEYPADRISFILGDAKVPLLLVDPSSAAKLPLLERTCLCISEIWPEVVTYPSHEPTCRSNPDDLAYVIYTSGSSGRPKGVGVVHRGLSAYLGWCLEAYSPEDGEGVPMHGSLAFDATVTSLFPPLLVGKTIFLVAENKDLSALSDLLTSGRRFSLVKLTPAHLEMLNRTLKAGSVNVGILVVGGEALSPKTVANWYQKHPNTRIINEYGPTETVVGCITYEVTQDAALRETTPIGEPIAGGEVYVLDPHMVPNLPGVLGELYLGGPGLARGYLARPALTATKFVPHPFSSTPGARLYRTGDLVRFIRPAGMEPILDFLGRIDSQVKLRGYRIELGEIEAQLREHEAVAEALVIIREDTPGDQRLVAYIVAHRPWSPHELQEILKPHLPNYMIPSAFMDMQALPLTTNGKLDYDALPVPMAVSLAAYTAPRTAIEEAVVGVWDELLKQERVGLDDNFFQLGGHSLLAAQMVSRLTAIFQRDLPVRVIFAAPTPRSLARYIEQESQTVPVPPIHPARRDGSPLPLSFGQSRLWFLDSLSPGSNEYNVPVALRLRGAIATTDLEQVVSHIRARHEVLRTVFVDRGEGPMQVIRDHENEHLSLIDLSHLDPEIRAEEVIRLASAEMARPFNLEMGPLLRVLVLRESKDSHALLACMHHTISDGWSMGIFVSEWVALYRSALHNKPASLQPLELQYADYSVWQRGWLQGDLLDAQVAYWRGHLLGAPELLELPTDRPRSLVQSATGSTYEFIIDAELSQGLKALTKELHATPFMALLGAYATLLSRYSHQQEVVIGTPIANRHHPGLESMIGFFVNTLALRVDLRGNPSFTELLMRVRERSLEAFAHQDLPFEKLVEEIQPSRSLSHTPIFQAMFSLQQFDQNRLSLPGVEVEKLNVSRDAAQFDLTLSLTENWDRFEGNINYRTEIFDEKTVSRMVKHFQSLLANLVARPGEVAISWDLTTFEERAFLLEALAASAAYKVLFKSPAAWVAERADRHGESVAIEYRGEQLTYRALEDAANRLAAQLLELGARPEVPVVISLTRTPSLLIAILAIHKVGAPYVPVDPTYPEERRSYVLKACRASLALAEPDQLNTLEQYGMTSLPVPFVGDGSAPAAPVQVPVLADHLAYILFTSGSTGKPKGVAISLGATHALLSWAHDFFPDEAWDGVLASTSINFDLSIFEILGTLTRGGRLILVDSILDLVENPPQTTIRLLNTVPSAAAELLRAHAVPKTVLVVNLAGEALPTQIVAGLYALGHVRKVYNLYGPSEDTTYSTQALVSIDDTIPPIGQPIAATQAYILDAWLNLVPIGLSGELYLAGAGLARGYYGKPALTAERFVPNPFAFENSKVGERLYQTGDLVRCREDGQMLFLSRIDHQVKLRGFRIEPGEIEAALREHDMVRDALVIVRKDGSGNPQLVAYLASDETPKPQVWIDWLMGRLPAYMLPGAFVTLPQFPLTPNGKLDRSALPDPQFDSQEQFIEPSTPLEKRIAAIWATILRLEQVSTQQSFFQLGGHSLLAIQVISRIEAATGVKLPLTVFFETPSVAGLAQAVIKRSAELNQTRTPSQPSARIRGGHSRIPLSFGQSRLWFLDSLSPGSIQYNMPVALRLKGAISIADLEGVITEIRSRHEVLRTVMVDRGQGPVQEILPEARVALPFVDLSHLDAETRDIWVKRLAIQELTRPFDLAQGPLLRVIVLRESAGSHGLLSCMHHTISDGVSIAVFIHEWVTLYRAALESNTSPLPPLELQYADYAIWQREWLQGDVLNTQMDFWRNHLIGAPEVLELPTDRPRSATQNASGSTVEFSLEADLGRAIHDFSQKVKATPFMLLLGAYAALMSRYSNQSDVVIGTPMANRHHPGLEPMIGFFANTLALRLDLTGHPNFTLLVERVKQRALEAYGHQDLPFEKLVEELQPVRSLSHTPLFQTMFSLQHIDESSLTLPGLDVNRLEVPLSVAQFDLTLALVENNQRFAGSFNFRTELFDRSTIVRMAGHFTNLLRNLLSAPEVGVTRWDMTGADERVFLLATLAASQAPALPFVAPVAWISKRARERGEAVAIECRGEQITYAVLEASANHLAAQLQQLGVQPEKPVVISLSRTPRLLVAILAIHKLGAPYVPVDPAYPKERQRLILAECGADLALAEDSGIASYEELGITAIAVPVSGLGDETQAIQVPVVPEQLAYILYTSGSTGKPKGVAISLSSVHAMLGWAQECFPEQVWDGVLAGTSINFDLSIYEILGTLTQGGRLVLVDNILDLIETPPQTTIRLLNTVPSAAAELLRAGAVPKTVSVVNLAGEALPAKIVSELYRLGHVDKVFNLYGPSEDTTYSTVALVDPKDSIPPIGKPIIGTRAYVLDAWLNPVPLGLPGELYLGGAGLARGYYQNGAMTAERFVPDLFCDPMGSGGDRLYKTGDLVRCREDGELVFLSRIDHQVKLRGYRIEPGDIEATLLEHPMVENALVMVRQDTPGNPQLVAYLVFSRAWSKQEFVGWLAERLPSFMVPAAFVEMIKFPLTANGKVNRSALPEPKYDTKDHFAEPSTPLEETIAAVWSKALGHERVSVNESFFHVGGHSMLAIRVTAMIEAETGVRLPLTKFFENPTVAGLAVAVSKQLEELPNLKQAAISRVSREGDLVLSSTAARTAASTALIQIGAVSMEGPLDSSMLAQAVAEMYSRHESLRTSYPIVGEARVVRISPLAGPGSALAVIQLGDADSERQALESNRCAREMVETAFSREGETRLLCRLLAFGHDQWALLWAADDLTADSWSMALFGRELFRIYRSLTGFEVSTLLPLELQPVDFSAWQEACLKQDTVRQFPYWQEHLRNAGSLTSFYPDRPAFKKENGSGGVRVLDLPSGLQMDLRGFAYDVGSSSANLMLAAFAILLGRYQGCSRVVLGMAAANRGREDVVGLLGVFANVLPLCVDLGNPHEGGHSFRHLISKLNEDRKKALASENIPFIHLAELLGDPWSDTQFPILFDSDFQPVVESGMPKLIMKPADQGYSHGAYDLKITVRDLGTRLAVTCAYDGNLYDETTINRLCDRYEKVLTGLLRTPDRPIYTVALMDEREHYAILLDLNNTGAGYPRRKLVHQLFETYARKQEQVLALDGTPCFDYGTLNCRANLLAGHLRAHGVRSQDRVCLVAEQTSERVMGMLAILKAGGVIDGSRASMTTAAYYLTSKPRAIELPANANIVYLEQALGSLPPQAEDNSDDHSAGPLATAFIGADDALISHTALVSWIYGARPRLEGAWLNRVAVPGDSPLFTYLLPLCLGGCLVPVETALLLLGTPKDLATQVRDNPEAEAVWALDEVSDTEALQALMAQQGLSVFSRYASATLPLGACEVLSGDRYRDGVIGNTIANVRTYILDEQLQPLPMGMVGRLFFSGPGMVTAWHGQAALTASRLIPHPFIDADNEDGPQPGERLGDSGRLARYLSDGRLILTHWRNSHDPNHRF